MQSLPPGGSLLNAGHPGTGEQVGRCLAVSEQPNPGRAGPGHGCCWSFIFGVVLSLETVLPYSSCQPETSNASASASPILGLQV